MKPTIKDRILAVASFPLLVIGVPLFYGLDWWSEKVDGVEPKSGQSRHVHKDIDGQTHVRHAGLKHRLDKWKPVGKMPPGYADNDIMSFYPMIVEIDSLAFLTHKKPIKDMTPTEKAWAKIRLNSEY